MSTRKTRAERDLDVLRSSERQGECAGKSIIEMIRAELVRMCIRYLRHKGYLRTGRGKASNDPELLRGEIIGLSKALLIYELPYDRGNEEERKKVVGRALKEAKRIEEYMTNRGSESVKPRDFRVSDSGSLMTELSDHERPDDRGRGS